MAREWDSIIVGGGVAGLSAALVLGRARRTTLLIDKGEQSNLPAQHVGGLIGQVEVSPAELVARGRKQLEEFPTVELLDGEAVEVRAESSDGRRFTVVTADGAEHGARTLVLAMGQAYVPPDIPGVADLWGRDVFHCPFCHGWEVRDRKVVVLGGDVAEHQLTLIRGWTDDVSVVDPGEVESLRIEDGSLRALVRPDGSEIECEALMVKAEMHDRSDIPDQLGLDRNEHGLTATDAMAQTSVPGVFAAGDLAVAPQQVAIAMGSGHLAGAMAVRDLLT